MTNTPEQLLCDTFWLAVFPTGGGKSLCCQLPALMFGGVASISVRHIRHNREAMLTAGDTK